MMGKNLLEEKGGVLTIVVQPTPEGGDLMNTPILITSGGEDTEPVMQAGTFADIANCPPLMAVWQAQYSLVGDVVVVETDDDDDLPAFDMLADEEF